MIARVAESCYWLTRYVERADTVARLLSVQSGMVLDTVLPSSRTWLPLIIVVGEEPRFVERFGREAADDGEGVQDFLTWDEGNPTSIVSSLHAARENARTVRETISLEMWNGLNSTWLWLRDGPGRTLYDTERQAFYDHLNERCNLFRGVTQNTVLHEEPFDFMQLGLNLERAGQTARILDIHHHALDGRRVVPEESLGAAEWIAILRSRNAYEPFFKRGSVLNGPEVAEFLLLDAAFPTSVAYTLEGARRALGRIRPDGSRIGQRSADLLDSLSNAVVRLDLSRTVEYGIHEILTHIVDETARISGAIGEEYFYALAGEPDDAEAAMEDVAAGAAPEG